MALCTCTWVFFTNVAFSGISPTCKHIFSSQKAKNLKNSIQGEDFEKTLLSYYHVYRKLVAPSV